MPLILTVVSGPAAGQVFQLKSGHVAYVGRGEELDLSFPDDGRMSHQHFVIEGRPDCGLLADLRSTNGTYVNGQRITEVIVAEGDQIVAGSTTFVVGARAAAKQTAAAPAPVAQPRFDQPAAATCQGLQLTEAGRALVTAQQTVAELVQQLRSQQCYADALRVLSQALGAAAAILWACDCIQQLLGERLSADETAALQAAQSWATRPAAPAAAAAYQAAQSLGSEGPEAMLALAAYWAAGNLAAPGRPQIPVDPQLPSQAISGALTLVAVNGPAEEAAERYESFIRRAVSPDES